MIAHCAVLGRPWKLISIYTWKARKQVLENTGRVNGDLKEQWPEACSGRSAWSQLDRGRTALRSTWTVTKLSRSLYSTSSAFGLVTVSGCAPYAAVDVQRPSFPGCRLASLEQSATPRHVCTVTACFPQSSEDPSLQTQFSFDYNVVPAKWHSSLWTR